MLFELLQQINPTQGEGHRHPQPVDDRWEEQVTTLAFGLVSTVQVCMVRRAGLWGASLTCGIRCYFQVKSIRIELNSPMLCWCARVICLVWWPTLKRSSSWFTAGWEWCQCYGFSSSYFGRCFNREWASFFIQGLTLPSLSFPGHRSFFSAWLRSTSASPKKYLLSSCSRS